jgi:hypothetical protein
MCKENLSEVTPVVESTSLQLKSKEHLERALVEVSSSDLELINFL